MYRRQENLQASPVTFLVRTVLLVPTQLKEKNMSRLVSRKPRVHLSVGWIGLNIPEKYWSEDKTTNVYKNSVTLVTWQTESIKTFVQHRDSLSLKS